MKVVVVALDVIPAVNRFVVVTELDTTRLLVNERVERFETCQTFRVPTLAVVATRFVVKELRFEI